MRLGLKFGCPLGEVDRMVEVAQSLDVKLVGISYHVGSGNGCADSFGAAVADARRAFDIAAARGVRLTLLDIGGGFPGSELGATDPTSDRLGGAPQGGGADAYAKHPSFSAIAASVRTSLDAHFPEGCGVELIAEPVRGVGLAWRGGTTVHLLLHPPFLLPPFLHPRAGSSSSRRTPSPSMSLASAARWTRRARPAGTTTSTTGSVR